jgi:PAS domain S-box-containing protein
MPDRSKQGSLSIHGQNERWLREQALAASHAAIIITDSNEPGNPIVYANPAFERITGYSIEEAIGKNCRFLQGEDREQPALEELRAAIREGRDCQVTLRNYKKDGTLFWNELSISPVHDEEGNLSNFVGVLGDVTERKRVQEALQYQLDLTTTITDNAADSLFLWDTEGRVTFMNSAAEQTFGWRQEELLGEVLHDRMHHHYPDGRPYPISECPLVKVFESAQTLRDHEDVFFRKDGSPIDVSCSLAPIVVSGEITGAVLVVRDIIERKRAEKALQISETRFRTIIEQSPLSIQILSPDGRTLQVNRAWETLWGVTLKDVAGYNMLEDQQLAAKGIMPYIQRGFAGEPTSIPPIIYDPDETLPGLTSHEEPKRWVKAFIQPIKDEAGTVREVVLMHEDITERKQAEEELRESEERFRRTFEQAAVGIAHVGTDGHWLRVNRRLCDIVGYEKEELLGLTFQDITHPDDLETDLEGARQLLAGEIETYSSEKRYFRKDGSTVWIYLTVSLVRSPSDEPRYFISATEDITERKRVEEAQRFLAEAGESLSSSLDYRATLARVARLAVPYLADWCVVDILEEDGSLDRLAVAHQDPDKVVLAQELHERFPPDPEAERGIPQVLRTGRSELVPEIPKSFLEEAVRDAEYREILRELGLKSYMIVPLVARGRALGAISFVSAESGWRYGQTDLDLAEELARRAGLAVDNARLYRDRSEVARTLQEGLLPPRLPEVPGVEVGLSYVSAGEVDVGGDFYDLFDTKMVDQDGSSEPPFSSWGVVIGDVSGKGAEAAAMLAFARYTMRALATRESCPSTVLSGLNEAMLHQRRERGNHKFCTVVYIRLEADERNTGHGARITLSCGGHSPPFLLKADGSISKVGQPGRAVGVFDDANLTEQEARLEPGDALVLYTDGVVEARSPAGLFFGEERLMALLRSSVALDASTIASRIEEAVLNFQEQTPRDDVAVLVLRVCD